MILTKALGYMPGVFSEQAVIGLSGCQWGVGKGTRSDHTEEAGVRLGRSTIAC
jgi:hypothetical protein